MGKVIVISGVPGVGKTIVAKKLAKILNAIHIDLSEYVIRNKLYTEYDNETNSYVIDEDKVRQAIESLAKKYERVIISSHYGELTPRNLVEKIIVLRLDPEELEKRLEQRGWNRIKIIENIVAEILSVCTANALREHGIDKIIEIDTTNKNIETIINEIIRALENKVPKRPRIDWFERKPLEVLEKYLKELESLEKTHNIIL